MRLNRASGDARPADPEGSSLISARRSRPRLKPALTRSEVMSRVKGKDTTPERRVRSALHAKGHRFRLQARDLPGRPDIVFRGDRLAIFVHGCFWHRHADCPHCRTPKSRVEFWREKFAANVARDEAATASLNAAGWRVETIWECEARDGARLGAFVERVTNIRERSREKSGDRDKRSSG